MQTISNADAKPVADASGYHYSPKAELGQHHAYLMPPVLNELKRCGAERVFDLGCGDGSVAAALTREGFRVAGVDPSEQGIAVAQRAYPQADLRVGSAYDDLAGSFGTYPAVISLEVVEHVYDPRSYARTLFSLIEPGGTAIISTPYHGYLKNLVLALTGKMDAHYTALWDHGHIKFWSVRTLSILLREAGFENVRLQMAGRLPALAKSMIAVAVRPPVT